MEADLSTNPKHKKENTANYWNLNASDIIDSSHWLWITVNNE